MYFTAAVHCFWLRLWFFIAIQPKAIGCQPILAIQSTSTCWQADAETCVRYMMENWRGWTPWGRHMRAQMSTFPTSSSSLRSTWTGTWTFKKAYFVACFGCIRFIFTLCSFEFDFTVWENELYYPSNGTNSCAMIDILHDPCCQGLTTWSLHWGGTSVGPAAKARDLSLLLLWK